jgi:hypothetical protein
MKANERILGRLQRERPMTTISIRVPEDVIEDLKEVALELGFSGYPPLAVDLGLCWAGTAEGPGAAGARFDGEFSCEPAAAGSCGRGYSGGDCGGGESTVVRFPTQASGRLNGPPVRDLYDGSCPVIHRARLKRRLGACHRSAYAGEAKPSQYSS